MSSGLAPWSQPRVSDSRVHVDSKGIFQLLHISVTLKIHIIFRNMVPTTLTSRFEWTVPASRGVRQ